MFTSKQLWRKQQTVAQGFFLRRSLSDTNLEESICRKKICEAESEAKPMSRDTSIASSLNSPVVSPPQSPECSPGNPARRTIEVTADSTIQTNPIEDSLMRRKKKTLRFDNMVKVTLIPTLREYRESGLHKVLWCSPNELREYKDSAFEEIKEYMKQREYGDFRKAMKEWFLLDTELDVYSCNTSHRSYHV